MRRQTLTLKQAEDIAAKVRKALDQKESDAGAVTYNTVLRVWQGNFLEHHPVDSMILSQLEST